MKTVHALHSRQTVYKCLFAGQTSAAAEAHSQMHGTCSIQHYTVKSMLYLQMIKDEYIEIYNKFISQLQIYAKAVRILAKGYLPISLVTPLKLQEIPEYDIAIKRLHLYYDMKLVAFGIDRKRNLIIQLPIFVQPYIQ